MTYFRGYRKMKCVGETRAILKDSDDSELSIENCSKLLPQ